MLVYRFAKNNKAMSTITIPELLNLQSYVLVDVRNHSEYQDCHLNGAINIPADKFDPAQYESFNDKEIVLVCQSGNRAKKVYERLLSKNITNVKVLNVHMHTLSNSGNAVSSKKWSVDRQFRFFLGAMTAVALIGYLTVSPYFLIIPSIFATGLIVTSIIDNCYMRNLIALMPWNK